MPALRSLLLLVLGLLVAAPAGAARGKAPATQPQSAPAQPPAQIAVPPANDVCSGAILIPSGNINLAGTTSTATNNYTFVDTLNACTGYRADGADVVYKVNVGPGDSLWVDYRNITDGSIYIVSDCGNVDGSCIVGVDETTFPGATESLRYKFTVGGTYFIILDSYSSGSSGDWTLVGQLLNGPQSPPQNDLWEAAINIPCGPISLSGNTQFAHNYYNAGAAGTSCTGQTSNGREVVYRMTVVPGDSLALDYTSTTNGSMYIVGDGTEPEGTCVAGADQTGAGQAEQFRYRFPYGGVFYLMLDSRDTDTFGSWTATGTLVCLNPPPENDICLDAPLLPCGEINLSGTTERATNNYFFPDTLTCTGYNADGRDVGYLIDAQAGDSIYVDYLSAGTDAAIYLTTDCSDVGTYCVAGMDEGITNEHEYFGYRFVSGGTYYLILDSVDPNTWGNWTLVGNMFCGPVSVTNPPRAARLEMRPISPNPFGETTAIGFGLPARANVSLRIYDLQGRVLRTLVDGSVEPGEHRVAWDARDDHGARVVPGVYFARLSSAGTTSIRRMIFVR